MYRYEQVRRLEKMNIKWSGIDKVQLFGSSM
jgi:hypothetical protein